MSFYTSLSGLKNAQTDLNVVAHNIANAETNGFKKSRVEFADVVAGTTSTNPRMLQGIGATVESITQTFLNGPIEQTGGSLDLAITGNGFFATKSAVGGQALFTRNGAFTMDKDGNVQDGQGNILQIYGPGADPATATPIDAVVPTTNAAGAVFAGISVSPDGAIVASYADGTNEPVGTVALATFVSPPGLKQVGSSNWQVTGLSGPAQFGAPGTASFGGVLSGTLERSNVDIAEELVNLITAQRYFQANAKAIDTATQISQSVMNLRT